MKRISARRFATASAAIGIAAVSVAVTPITATASTHHAKSLLQQGLAFYKGKTISLIAPDNTGGGFDLTARAIAPYLAQYLGATVNVTNDAPANTIAGQDLFMAQRADGLTIGMVNAGVDIETQVTGTPGVNFNAQRTQFLGGNGASGSGFSCLASSPYHTFADVVHASQVTEAVISTGSQTLQTDLLNASFNIHAKIIGGYASTSLEVAGFERGDGECGPFSISTGSFGPFLVAGKAHELLKFGPSNPATAFYSQQVNSKTIQSAFKQFPAKTKNESLARTALLAVGTGIGHEWNVAPGVANYKVAALRAAVKAALTNIKCEDTLLSEGQQNGFVSPARALNLYKQEYAALKKVAPLIKSALGV